MSATDDNNQRRALMVTNIVDPIECMEGSIQGHISSRLMAAYDLGDGHGHCIEVERYGRDAGRVAWHYILSREGHVIFDAHDLATPAGATYGEAARSALQWLTLRPGDVDAEYFDGYTAEQVAWRDEYAEELSMFGMEPNEANNA